MAYSNVKVFGSIKRARGEETVISTAEIKGKPVVDIRINYHDEEGELRPTSRGITVAPNKLGELIEILNLVESEISKGVSKTEESLENLALNIEDIEVV